MLQDQWQRKKQTKEQKKAARMAKLDPDNVKTAKDVMDERAAAAAKKRKRGDDDEHDPADDLGMSHEKPKQGLKTDQQKSKKQKIAKDAQAPVQNIKSQASEDSEEAKRKRKAEKKAAKRERKKAKAERSKAKRERQKARSAEAVVNEVDDKLDLEAEGGGDEEIESDEDMVEAIDVEPAPQRSEAEDGLSASPSPAAESPNFDSPHNHSASSSISSIQPPITTDAKPAESEKSTTTVSASQPKASPDEIRARLAARIEALRAARKADGPNGKPARSRQELLEARRKKEEERQAHKKELRRKAKEEEARKQDEEIAARFSPGGSGSLLASPRSPMAENNNFSFGRVAFSDGTQADANLTSLLNPNERQKTKGPSDPRSQLNAAEKKASRLAGLDSAKRADIEQKDMWLIARKRAHGEKVKDDTSLLKKALKRQEVKKEKSDKEWKARNEGVEKGIQDRQRKREENLKKRKDERGAGKKGKGGPKVKRPGFEGSFRAKHGNSGGGKK